jgi:DNA/RNA-binding domain of Phe-tRNA-synthetase-like protein
MLIHRTDALVEACPHLIAEVWDATVGSSRSIGLPQLREVASSTGNARQRAENMSQVFSALGARGRSPVEFQIERAATGALVYSRRDALVDFLLYAEVWTGILIGFHDTSAVEGEVQLGVAGDAAQSAYEHISQKMIELKLSEPVIMAGRRIIGSLRHGPDYVTRVTSDTKKVWAVAFGSPGETPDELESLASSIAAAGVEFGVWSIASR